MNRAALTDRMNHEPGLTYMRCSLREIEAVEQRGEDAVLYAVHRKSFATSQEIAKLAVTNSREPG